MSSEDAIYIPLDKESALTGTVYWVRRFVNFFWNFGPFCLICVPIFLFIANFTTAILSDHLPIMEILFLRSLTVILFILTFQKAQNGSIELVKGEKWGFVILNTIVGALTNIFAFTALTMIPLSDALTIIYANIALTAIINWSFSLEKFKWYGFVGVSLCLIGLLFVVQPDFLFPDTSEDKHTRSIGILLAILACLCCALGLAIKRVIGTAQRPDLLTFYAVSVTIPITFVCLLLGYPDKVVYSRQVWHYSVVVANALGSFVGSIMVNRSVVIVSGTLTAIASSFQMILAHFTDLFFQHEDFSFFALIGSLLMIFGCALTVFSRKA